MLLIAFLVPATLVVHVCASAPTTMAPRPRVAAAAAAPPAATTAADVQFVDDAAFRSAMLDGHNFFRDEHGAAALAWNDTSAAYAGRWVGGCAFQHSGGPTGENIAAGFPNATAVVDSWAGERAQYDFSHPGFASRTGHFTQVVWRATTSVGCARLSCGANGPPGYYVVCEYYPAGNVVDQFADNVQPQTRGPEDGTVEQGLSTAGSLRVPWKELLAVFAGAVCVAMELW